MQTGDCSNTGIGDSYDNWFIVDLVHYVTMSYVNVLGRETTRFGVSKLKEFIQFLSEKSSPATNSSFNF